MRIGVVGAGPAGLCAIRQALSFGCEVVAFEQGDKLGGTWNYTDETGKDKNGLDVHSSMYRGLFTNIPKEIMSYPDFPMDKEDERSFLSAQEVLNYLQTYAANFNLSSYIKFEHHVLRVRPLSDDKWEFVVTNFRAAGKLETYIFDAVLVCNGFSESTTPKIPGQGHFKGKQLHSHLYRSSSHYMNKNVLVIGGGPSGIDLTVEIGKVAQRVVWSNHVVESIGMKVNLNLPVNALEKPDVLELTETGARFVDGSTEEFTTIIYATGYDYKFPFLSIDCGLHCHEKYVQPLYKHCININRPTMGIIGLPYFAVAMPLFDLQIRFCLTFMTQMKTLPSRDEMLNDTEREMKERWKTLKRNKAHFLGMEKHAQYYEELSTTADIEGLKPVIAKIFNKSFTNFFVNFETFRSFSFKIVDDENFAISSL